MLIGTAETAATGVNQWETGTTVVSRESVWKRDVHASSFGLGNVTLVPAPATIDGVTLVTTNRYGVINQTAGAANGIYVFDGTNLVRAEDYDTGALVEAGVKFYTQAGTANAKKTYRLYSPTTAITVGVTVTLWEEDGGGGGSSSGILEYHQDMPPAPGAAAQYKGWVPVASELVAVRAYMEVVNTVGTYTLAVTNVGTGNTALSAASFNMNTLVATNVTSVALTGTPADLVFAAQGRWTITLTSNNAGFDGSGVYIELEFAHGTAGLSGQDLSTTLGFGNATGGFDIVLSTADQIVGEGGISLAGDAVLRGGTAVSGVADGGDVVLRPGAGVGGGDDGHTVLQSANGTFLGNLDETIVRLVLTTIAAGAVATLNATPVTIIAAPAAGLFIEIVRAHAWLDFATTAYDGVAAGEDLVLKYTNAAGATLTNIVAGVGFADQVTDQHRVVGPINTEITPVAATPVVAHVLVGEWFAAAGNSPVKIEVLYRIRTLEPA
jgi:hypothetical protein